MTPSRLMGKYSVAHFPKLIPQATLNTKCIHTCFHLCVRGLKGYPLRTVFLFIFGYQFSDLNV